MKNLNDMNIDELNSLVKDIQRKDRRKEEEIYNVREVYNTLRDKNVEALLNFWEEKVLILEVVLHNEKDFHEMRNMILNQLGSCFEIKEARTCQVKYKFKIDDTKIHTMELRHLYTHLCLWSCLIGLNKGYLIDETYLVDMYNISAKTRKKYYDEMIIIPFREEFTNSKLNSVIHDSVRLLAEISYKFNPIIGNTFNMKSFMDLYDRNDEFVDLLNTNIDPDLQPKEAETWMDGRQEKLINLLKTEDNVLKPILQAREGIKEKQLTEFFACVAYKPDIEGDTIPIPINSNFAKGLGSITNYYIESNSSIKALLANKYEMGNSGYFSKQVSELCAGYILDDNCEDCGTVRLVKVEMKTMKHLETFIGQYYMTRDNHKLRMLTKAKKSLLGKTLYFRNAITCACKGNHICKTCYGALSKINNNGFSIGMLAAVTISEPIGQNILSTKHLNTTDSILLLFNNDFDRFFNLSSNEIMVNLDKEDIHKYSLQLVQSEIERMNEHDDNTSINTYVKELKIVHSKTKEVYSIFTVKKEEDGSIVNSGQEIFLSPEVNKTMQKLGRKVLNQDIIEIPLTKIESSIDDEGDEVIRIGIMQISNNELTKPLYDIKNLLNSKKHRGSMESIDEIYQKFVDLLLSANISAPSSFSQIVMRPLVKRLDNPILRPNFKSYKDWENVTVLTVDSAQVKHDSILMSISSHSLGNQLTTLSTYKKGAGSMLDPIFKE